MRGDCVQILNGWLPSSSPFELGHFYFGNLTLDIGFPLLPNKKQFVFGKATDQGLNNAIFQSRQLACQTKQMNIQTMLTGRDTIDGSKANIRAGLQDALTNIPSGANGAVRSAGWTNVRDGVIARVVTRLEKLFATGGNGSTPATAATLVVEGDLFTAELVGL